MYYVFYHSYRSSFSRTKIAQKISSNNVPHQSSFPTKLYVIVWRHLLSHTSPSSTVHLTPFILFYTSLIIKAASVFVSLAPRFNYSDTASSHAVRASLLKPPHLYHLLQKGFLEVSQRTLELFRLCGQKRPFIFIEKTPTPPLFDTRDTLPPFQTHCCTFHLSSCPFMTVFQAHMINSRF